MQEVPMTRRESTLRALPMRRLRLAALLVALCTLAGMKTHCWDMIRTDGVVLVSMAAIQGASALVSFARMVIAGARRDAVRAAMEAFTCAAMLLVVPLAFGALFGAMPECRLPPGAAR